VSAKHAERTKEEMSSTNNRRHHAKGCPKIGQPFYYMEETMPFCPWTRFFVTGQENGACMPNLSYERGDMVWKP